MVNEYRYLTNISVVGALHKLLAHIIIVVLGKLWETGIIQQFIQPNRNGQYRVFLKIIFTDLTQYDKTILRTGLSFLFFIKYNNHYKS